jgi:uncharacterized membrane protein
VSADDKVVVGSGTKHGLSRTAAGGMVDLGFLPGDDYIPTEGVSADGKIVVGYSGADTVSGPQAVRWTIKPTKRYPAGVGH